MYNDDFRSIIQTTYPFDLLTEDQLEAIMKDARRLAFRENEFLFTEEDEEVEVYFLLKGLAKNVLHQQNGKQFSVRFYYPGDLVGTLILLAGGHLNFSVQALEDCETVLIKKSTFLQVMTENQSFSNVILAQIGQRMKSLYDELKSERSQLDEDDSDNIALFRTRVHSMMEKASLISEEQSLDVAAKKLLELNTPGLIVTDQNKGLRGVITNQQVIQGLLKKQENDQVNQWMNDNPQWVQEDAFSYEVLTYFREDHVDIVPVLKKDKVVGVLTAESFLQLQDSKYLNLSQKLQHASSIIELAKLSPKNNEDFIAFTEALLDERTYPSEVCELISNYNDQLHRKIIVLSLQEMKREGYGNPPINYCFIVMGSQGRKEQAFSTDQDNGLILDNYEHLHNKKEVEGYFKKFAEKINASLVKCGFPECSGGIMAKEEKWCRSLYSWKEEVKRWVKETDGQEVRDFTIFADYRPIYGDFKLAEKLRDEITPVIQKGKILHAMLMKDTIRFRVPINPLGRIATKGKNRTLDIKKSAMMQIVNGIRIFAIRYGVKAINTKKRLYELQKLEVFHPRDVKNAIIALDYLHYFRIRENMNQIIGNKTLSNELSTLSLSKDEKKQLKEALYIAKRLQQMSELSFARNRGI